MIFGSLCSGMEAASAAWHPLGWQAAFLSEIDPTAARFLAAKYPGVPNYGDMTKFQEWPDHAIDVLVGGTPCQSFSVAGLRKGLDDPRGNLMLTFGAVAKRYQPRIILWENVPGVLSSNGGRDFGAFLGMLGELGYGFAYRVLDAQFVRVESHPRAVPQRRRRVFVVGYFGDWRRAAAILFERASLSGNSPPRRETGKGVAPTIAARTKGGGGLGTDFDCDGGLIAKSLRSRPGNAYREDADTFIPTIQPADMLAFGEYGPGDTASTMKSRDYKDATDLVAHTLRANYDASEDGSGRGTPLVPVVAGTMMSMKDSFSNSPDHAAAGYMLPIAFPEYMSGTQVAAAENLSPSLGATNPTAISYGFQPRIARNGRGDTGPVAAALNAQSGETGKGDAAPHVAVLERQQWAVRRLTPLECTRLQGYEDDYFDSARLNKPLSDSAKYKLLGNSMAENVMSWLGQRIDMVDKL